MSRPTRNTYSFAAYCTMVLLLMQLLSQAAGARNIQITAPAVNVIKVPRDKKVLLVKHGGIRIENTNPGPSTGIGHKP